MILPTTLIECHAIYISGMQIQTHYKLKTGLCRNKMQSPVIYLSDLKACLILPVIIFPRRSV